MDAGGAVVVAGATGTMDAEGGKREQDPLFTGSVGSVFRWQSTDWQPEITVIRTLPGEPEMPVYPHLPDAPEGQALIARLEDLCEGFWLRTDAPWSVRARAWRAEETAAMPVHWINSRQDEEAAIETPIPMGPIRADLLLPADTEVDRVEWIYPEMKEPLALAHEVVDGRVSFEIPRLILYGISVIRLR